LGYQICLSREWGEGEEPWCTSIGKPVVYLSQIDADEEQISFDGLFFVTISGEVT